MTICNWKHAINDYATLVSIINSKNKYNCWEIDVTWNPRLKKPVIKHLPISFGLISKEYYFESFIQIISQTNWKLYKKPHIIKLDFKNVNCVKPTIDLLRKTDSIKFNFQFNADILVGPGNSILYPIDPVKFLSYCQLFPDATLSLGWTTGFDALRGSSSSYTKNMVNNMINITKDIKIPVTYPIRASLVKNSWSQLKILVDNTTYKRDILIWSGWEGLSNRDMQWIHNNGLNNLDLKKINNSSYLPIQFQLSITSLVFVILIIFRYFIRYYNKGI